MPSVASIPAEELLPAPAASDERRRDSALRYASGVWLLVVVFGAVAMWRSAVVDVPFKDPDGRIFRDRLTMALVLLVVAGLLDVGWRTQRAGWSRSELVRQVRERWSGDRVALALTGLAAYHLVYLSYRNLKSWDAFNTPRDADLLALDERIFGEAPWVLLHDLLGRDTAAWVLMVVYKSFTYLVPWSLLCALVLSHTMRRGYVFLAAAMWTWVLGTLSYYLVPSLGPFATAAEDFRGLPDTPITDTWAEYLDQRAAFLADPRAPDTFVSISAFASLHTGFTCMVMLMAFYYGHRVLGAALGVYLAVVMVSTIYWGWHFTVDDVAGIVIAVLAVALGHVTVTGLRRQRP